MKVTEGVEKCFLLNVYFKDVCRAVVEKRGAVENQITDEERVYL